MKTKLIRRKPVEVISSGLTRQQDLADHDAVLIVNPEKFAMPPDGRAFELIINFGDPSDKDASA